MKNKNNNRVVNSKSQQHFSIRKLTVGAVSVLIGVTFLGVKCNQVHAAETGSNDAQTEAIQERQDDNVKKDIVSVPANNQNSSTINQDKTQETKTSTQLQSTTEPTENVTLPNNKAQEDLTNNEKALIPANGNTISNQPKINNDQGMTNVPKNGTVEYDYSISAKDKATGKVEVVHSAEEYKDNSAYLNKEQAENIEAHITLTNISDQDQTIGNNNSSNNDGAQLFINVYNPNHDSSLIVSSDVAPSITYYDKDGKVISGDSMTVLYRDKTGTWYTYDDFKKNISPEDYRFITSVGYKGILPANTTAQLNVPLAINPDNPTGSNQFAIFAVEQKSINVNVINNANPLWTIDEVKDDKPYLTFRNSDGTYQLIPNSDSEAIEKEMPTMGDVLQIVSPGLNISSPKDAFYAGGTFRINLPTIQQVLQKYGYSVALKADTDGTISIMPYYTYSTTGGLVIKSADGQGIATNIDYSRPFFYIEVHKIIDTENSSMVQGSTEAKDWNYLNNVIGVTNLENPTSVSTGVAWSDVPGEKSNVKLVSIKDANGNSIASIDENTPAGVYDVTVSYKLDNSENAQLLIEKTYTVTITPKAPDQPTEPVQPTNNPTEPIQPTTPVAPTTPQEPVSPVSPDQPVQPSSSENVRPLPESPSDNSKNNNGGSKQKDNVKSRENTNNHDISSTKNPTSSSNIGVKSIALSTKGKTEEHQVTSLKNTKEIVKKQSKNTLPQTGQKESALAFWGIALASLAGILGLGARKKEN